MARIKTTHAVDFRPTSLNDIETVEVTADLLIIGGGNAGCFVATEAAKLNPAAKIVIVEKADIMRSGACSAGMDAINTYIPPNKTPEDLVRWSRSQVGGGPLGTAADSAIPVDLDLLHGQRQHYGLTGVIHHVEPGGGLQIAGGIELQIAHAGIGLCPIGILHRNPALAVDGDVKIPPRGLQQAMLQVLTRPLRHGEHPRGQSFAKRLHAARLLEIRLEADGVGIGQVVATHSQAVHVLLGPGHGDIKQVIHGILRQTDDSRRTTAN